ncbi:hypothetical protein LCGC14_1621150, partial [marine sediment metagenome]
DKKFKVREISVNTDNNLLLVKINFN